MTGDSIPRGRTARGRDGARRRAARLSLGCGLLTVGVSISITAVAGSPRFVYQYVPLLLSVVVLGLPHGAVDHLVLPRARGAPVTARSVGFVCVLYLFVGTAYAVFWWLAPAAAFALFVLGTLVHWGQGDVYALLAFVGADYLETRADRLLALIVRGGIPMLVPLIAFPERYASVAETLVGTFAPGSAARVVRVVSPTLRTALAIGVGTGIALALLVGLIRAGRDDRGAWLVDLTETLGLVAYFAVVPPVLAIGLYFCFWHSLRHVLRTMLVDPVARSALDRGAISDACRRFSRDAMLPTAGGLVIFVAIGLTVPQTPATVPDVVALYLVTIAVLTPPHVVVVTLLDREQRIWDPTD
ncbi:Brp/Blh family beta-carotene 15,15'-dioxygenase [Natrinema halophilum]|uniref:Probable beta-carotene 15,15'-dioxygenase n=1 Tax=Natrinema halophilum TaxID=1699371 RepID=A0A7D5GTG7_9EURY|nr:Brp/Blh family beta-carotene 15,15'-dioxygenase [Natrinema halophilum]QLG49306.1 Brp/Blh family beta-carotene 15,15'-dioxygenase [Natrinema halophilum]